MNLSTALSLIITVFVCGILYYRMVKREIPEPIGWIQALVPIALGMATMEISGFIGVKLFFANTALRTAVDQMPSLMGSLVSAFMAAGMPEEVIKFIAIILFATIFKPRLKNVYEYILLGAAVGFGFTIMEEMAYSGDDTWMEIIYMLLRKVSVPAHMAFNMLMGEFIGIARYRKVLKKESSVSYYIIALFAPIIIHTIYDAFTALNKFIVNPDSFVSGIILVLVGYIGLPVWIIYMLIRCKKKTGDFCSMILLPE
ncbi:PrsW family glutamic-type intramembrane protease [Oribacterium sp. FC2011]|uniref:PrsW family glutamic-type intramembrane protease n=1 Tax=Oribacterium sp. FC2011 TaxID=1408311 RepID=UPI0004E2101E|nr:PrsW family glutamic-type intramembrane protease [Oribacterium sp. FC2011]